MHIKVLVEDGAGGKLLETLLPQVIGEQGAPHTWRVHLNIEENQSPSFCKFWDGLRRFVA